MDAHAAAFFEWLCNKGGLDARHYRPTVLERRRGACLRAVRAGSLDDARARGEACSRSVEDMVGTVMIGVTSFFRDIGVFRGMDKHLPALAEENGNVIRAMSVGCSDGSELYSLAIQLAHHGLLENARLVGVDCRPDAIATAKAGIYTAAAVSHIDPLVAARSFERCGRMNGGVGNVRVREHLANACEWRTGNAFALPHALHDLILCRNLAIYLRPASAHELWAALADRLRPGGLLIVGKAERPCLPGKLVRIGACKYRRIEETS